MNSTDETASRQLQIGSTIAKTAISTAVLLLALVPFQASAQTGRASTEEPTTKSYTCEFIGPENPEYNAKFVTIRKKPAQPGEIFKMEVYMQNTGNTPWFSANSGCPSNIVNLGTQRKQDRESIFFADNLEHDSGWLGKNRIALKNNRVNPGELGVFEFHSRAPQQDGVYREFFAPVVEGVTWINSGLFKTDILIGRPDMSLINNGYISYIQESVDLSRTDMTGEKNILVDISEQRMWLKIGDHVIREQIVSSGKPSTPTPFGTTHIFQKQQVRVGSAPPHYIMPKWLHFRAGGYGIHALPSLGNDGGVFWTEALNHIGQRRSHGCIRLLPDDAAFTYDFADIGTRITVVP